MTNRLLLIALVTLVSLSGSANAGVMLYVDFSGANAASVVANSNALVTSYSPGADTSLTANIYLHLTDQSTLYGYQFSLRFNALALGLDLGTQTKLDAFQALQNSVRPDFFGGTPNSPVAPFGPPGASSGVSDPLTNGDFLEINRFNGYMDSGRISDNRFYKVATITFSVVNPLILSSGTQLVRPGKFDLKPTAVPPYSDDDVFMDTFFTEDNRKLEFSAFGGSVSNSSVPEPASVLITSVLGLLAVAWRKPRPTNAA